MGRTLVGHTATQFPINKPVGQQVTPQKTGAAASSVPVPPPAALLINGKTVQIDVRTMSGADIVTRINNAVPGVTASIDGAGSLAIFGVDTIEGDAGLRAMLGI